MKKILLAMALAVCLPVVAHAQNVVTYIVQKNDSLWKIAVAHQIGLKEIIDSNPQIPNPALIYPNQKINIPNLDQTKSIEQQVLNLTNQARAKEGLPPLVMDWEVQRVARIKSQDMINANYFSHQSPNYGSPFEMLKAYDIQYRSAGENIASGQPTPQAVVNAWLHSAGHRKNIMGNYTHLGVGYAKGGRMGHYWTQMFISK